MPTIYTVLRAQHRKSIHVPHHPTTPGSERPVEGGLSLLSFERARFASTSFDFGRRSAALEPQKKITVIGAGLAGLCVAYELKGLGYDVTVYEARDRVGGRVHSISNFIVGKTVEGGAELIGSNHPLWNAYAKHFRLRLSETKDYGNSPVRIDGHTLTFERSSDLMDEMEKQLKLLTNLAESIIDPFEPWMNRNALHLDSLSLADWLTHSKSPDDLCNLAIGEMLAADNGIPAEEQSLLGVLAMVKGGGLDRYWTDTELYRCEGGNQQLAEQFCKVLNANQKRVHLTTPVEALVKEGNRVVLKFKHGKSDPMSADEVVLAVPPSVWHNIRFEDRALEAQLQNPPAMGLNVKYLMRFQERFWEYFASSPTLSEDGPVDMTWETTEQDERPDFTMVAFSGSNHARTCVGWDAGDRRGNYIKALEAAYPGIGKLLCKDQFMDWPNEQWTNASYYFPRKNEVTKWGPFWKFGYGGWLHFAGEHTCYAFMGYMEGALASGYRLARRIAVRDGLLPG